MKKILTVFAVSIILFSCGKGEVTPPPTNEEVSLYGALQKYVDAFENDESILCKAKGDLEIDGNQYAIMSGLKNSHLYYQALDFDKKEVFKTWTGKSTVEKEVDVYVGYGETQTKTVDTFLPAKCIKTPNGYVTCWHASPIGAILVFEDGNSEKCSDYLLDQSWYVSTGLLYLWDNSVLVLPSSGTKYCYSYSGDVIYEVKAQTGFISSPVNSDGIYSILSQKEAIRFYMDTWNSEANNFHVVRLDLSSGEELKWEKRFSVDKRAEGQDPKVALEIKTSTDSKWTFKATVTEYSGKKTDYSFVVDINTLQEVD